MEVNVIDEIIKTSFDPSFDCSFNDYALVLFRQFLIDQQLYENTFILAILSQRVKLSLKNYINRLNLTCLAHPKYLLI